MPSVNMQQIFRRTPIQESCFFASFNITFNFAREKRQVAGYKNEVPRLLYSKF